jgi:hypothetical protein
MNDGDVEEVVVDGEGKILIPEVITQYWTIVVLNGE